MNRLFKNGLLAVVMAGIMAGLPLHAATVPVPGFYYPQLLGGGSAVTANTVTYTLDATAEKVALVFRIPASGDIEGIDFHTGTVTTSDTLYGIMTTVDGSGDPTTTLYGGMSTGTVSSLAANTSYFITFATPATAVRGDLVAAVIGFDSYVAGNLQIRAESSQASTFPYQDHFTASWAKSGTTHVSIGVRYSDGSYHLIPGTFPFGERTTTITYGGGSTPDEYSLYFAIPFDCEVGGFAVMASFAAGTTVLAKLYDSDGTTVLSTTTIDTDQYSGVVAYNYIPFSSDIAISSGTSYRMSFAPQSAGGTGIVLTYQQFATAAAVEQATGFDGTVYQSTRTNSGTWGQNTLVRPIIHMFVTEISGGASGGGAKSMFFME